MWGVKAGQAVGKWYSLEEGQAGCRWSMMAGKVWLKQAEKSQLETGSRSEGPAQHAAQTI